MDGDVGPVVVFDFDGVLALCRKAWQLADDLEAYRSSRNGAAKTALAMWRGPHAQQYATDLHLDEDTGLDTAIQQLRQGADSWAGEWCDAQQQHNNREHKIALKEEQSSRGFWEKLGDSIMGKDDSGEQMPEPPESKVPQPSSFGAPSSFVRYQKEGGGWKMIETGAPSSTGWESDDGDSEHDLFMY